MTAASYRPRIDLAAILAAQNPQIDLRLDEYERSTRSFMNLVANYTKKTTTGVSGKTDAYNAEKVRLGEKTQTTKAEINQCKEAEIELVEVLQQEQEERKEMESAVNALKRRLASIREKCASVDAEIEQYRSMVVTLEREKEREENLLRSRAQEVNYKLRACEEILHGVIEGIADDQILVRFTHIDPSDLDREFSLVIDVSSKTYKVPTSTPFLPTLPILVDELNRTRDLYNFIKQVWEAFDELTKQQ
ncbi:hypothetical protein BDM02DRAFT_2240921 [Thelephora ganbajun]|uniref:Uncharacterized protein n=1 Tax=Thelephora ganbajun TaxID=370292 RepID=A0ACB6ZFW3_THEGA|nr:hypothetical protein BDM02DRAFT_2240921 [Thelephora ganbajun]